MGHFISEKEAERRTGLELISDRKQIFVDRIRGVIGNVRQGQREMEHKYPEHKLIRLAAIKYFLSRGYDVYRFGITVFGTGTCLDFAIFRADRIKFVECLTWTWVYGPNIRKKKRIEKYAPLIFVVEDKSSIKFDSRREMLAYADRVRKLAQKNAVYWCNPRKARLCKCRPGRSD
jgi:hypothetical protein